MAKKKEKKVQDMSVLELRHTMAILDREIRTRRTQRVLKKLANMSDKCFGVRHAEANLVRALANPHMAYYVDEALDDLELLLDIA